MKKSLIILSILCFPIIFNAQSSVANVDQFIEELQVGSNDTDKMTLVWWIPVEFWDVVLKQSGEMSEEQIVEFTEVISPYAIFLVIDGKVGAFGNISYTDKKKIDKSVRFVGTDEKEYKALDEDDVSMEIQVILATFKPMFASMLGEMGENANFYVTKDLQDEGSRSFDPYSENDIGVKFLDTELTIECPISTLLPEKVCPEDGELLNGTWKYCPFHGEKLKKQN